jgi:ABC-type transport system substrate-binding protein
LAALVEQLAADPDETQRAAMYSRIQARLDELLPIVPLFAPRRIAVVKKGLPVPVLTHGMYALDPAWLAAAAR